MSLWIVDGGMVELPVVARVEDWKEGSYIEIVGSDDGAKWNDVPIRYVAERTCRDVYPEAAFCFTCSECGHIRRFVQGWNDKTDSRQDEFRYCPNCGRRVVAGEEA